MICCPRNSFPPNTPELAVAVAWQGKTPTRLPEALWLSWAPGPAAQTHTWALQKINSRAHPHDVRGHGPALALQLSTCGFALVVPVSI
jgi:hypothetical protein